MALDELIQMKARKTEACVVACIEAIENHVPTLEDVATYGRREVGQGFEAYYWRERMIVLIQYWPDRETCFRIFSLVNPDWPVPV